MLITTKGGRQKCKIKANIKKKRKTAEGELKKKVICVSATKKKNSANQLCHLPFIDLDFWASPGPSYLATPPLISLQENR